VGRAALGQRERDDGGCDKVYGDDRTRARRQAAWVVVWSILVAGLFTALVWWI
jgi:hypothetical protein